MYWSSKNVPAGTTLLQACINVELSYISSTWHMSLTRRTTSKFACPRPASHLSCIPQNVVSVSFCRHTFLCFTGLLLSAACHSTLTSLHISARAQDHRLSSLSLFLVYNLRTLCCLEKALLANLHDVHAQAHQVIAPILFCSWASCEASFVACRHVTQQDCAAQ